MRMSSSRRCGIPGALALVVAGVLVGIAAPANAANVDGRLQARGPGSAYAWVGGLDSPAVFSVAVTAGSAATYSLKAVNTGSSLAQYNLKLLDAPSGFEVRAATGAVTHSSLAVGPDGYFTSPIKPGAAETIIIKVRPPVGTPRASYTMTAQLSSTSGETLDEVRLRTEIAAPTTAGTAHDGWARSDIQQFVGAPVEAQYATAPSVKAGGTATFTVRVKNSSPGLSVIRFWLGTSVACIAYWTPTVKHGITDITTLATAAGGATVALPKGMFRDFTVSFKHSAGPTFCRQAVFPAYIRDRLGNVKLSVQLLVHEAI